MPLRRRLRRNHRQFQQMQKQNNLDENNDMGVYRHLVSERRQKRRTSARPVLLVLAVFYFAYKTFRTSLFPHGTASAPSQSLEYLPIDRTNDNLRFPHGHTRQLVADDDGSVQGPETVVLDGNKLLVMTETASLVELIPRKTKKGDSNNHTSSFVDTKVWKDLGIGRPLGGRFSGKTLYIADAALGLTRVTNYANPKNTVELVTHSVTLLSADGTHQQESPLLYCNAVGVGRKTGKIYFTDSTDLAPDRVRRKSTKSQTDEWVWDTLFASKLDLIRGRPTGRLCEFNPSTGQTRVLAENIHFANGVGMDPVKEDWIVVAETFGTNLLKYDLTHIPREGLLKPSEYLQPEILVSSSQLTGYVDNVDCAIVDQEVYCFGAVISEFVPIHRLLNSIPTALEVVLRNILLWLPRRMAPKIVPTYTGVVRIHMESKTVDYIQDPTGHDVQSISGVTVSGHELYLGFLHGCHIVVYDLKGLKANQKKNDKGPFGAEQRSAEEL